MFKKVTVESILSVFVVLIDQLKKLRDEKVEDCRRNDATMISLVAKNNENQLEITRADKAIESIEGFTGQKG